jgi:hypothetical protein
VPQEQARLLALALALALALETRGQRSPPGSVSPCAFHFKKLGDEKLEKLGDG